MEKLIKHKPIPQTGVTLGEGKDKKTYRCNRVTGILELPVRIEFYNPVEPVKEVNPKKVKVIKDEE